jgi:putative acetyltransferase
MQEISVQPFSPADQDEVKRLVLSGLVDHWGVLDPTRNPDLNDIAASYAGATFLVARRAGQAGPILACGALVPRGQGCAEIVRMSVAREMRRQGLGRLMLNRLVEQARAAGFTRIILETTDTWQEVISFYLGAGFRITHYADGDVYFALVFNGANN